MVTNKLVSFNLISLVFNSLAFLEMNKKRVVVLISGSGSNLQAFIDAQNSGNLGGEIVAVLSNRANVMGLERAEKADIDTHVIEHQNYSSREAFDHLMAEKINTYNPDLIILAGFMRILSEKFVKRFSGKLLNIHPSLLPKYPGLHTHQRALTNKDELHGSSVHFVTEELDGGPIIAQAIMQLDHKMSEKQVTLHVQELEHRLYPEVASWFLTDRLTMEKDGVYFDKEKLQAPIKLS
jgi:phosphoribosylglycinamide formyltransferase 1